MTRPPTMRWPTRTAAIVASYLVLGCEGGTTGGHLPAYVEAPIRVNAVFDLSPDSRDILVRQSQDGDGRAAFRLAEYYGFYAGDPVKAHHWEVRACQQDEAAACYNLAMYYEDRDQCSVSQQLFARAATLAREAGEDELAYLAIVKLDDPRKRGFGLSPSADYIYARTREY